MFATPNVLHPWRSNKKRQLVWSLFFLGGLASELHVRTLTKHGPPKICGGGGGGVGLEKPAFVAAVAALATLTCGSNDTWLGFDSLSPGRNPTIELPTDAKRRVSFQQISEWRKTKTWALASQFAKLRKKKKKEEQNMHASSSVSWPKAVRGRYWQKLRHRYTTCLDRQKQDCNCIQICSKVGNSKHG